MILTKKCVMLALSLAVSAAASQAQSDSQTMQITKAQAIDQALQFSKQLKNSRTDVEIYQEKIKEARSNWLPKVDASVQGQTYFGKEMNFGGMPIKMENSLTLKGQASWTFVLQAIKAYQVQRLAANLMETSAKNDELDVKKNISDTYDAVLIYMRNRDIVAQNLENMKELHRQTANLFKQGYTEKTDTMQMAVNVMTLQNAILSLDRSIETTKMLLVLQMGLPVSTKLELQDKIDDYLNDQNLSLMRQSVADGSQLNIENNLQYQMLKQNLQINEETVKVQKYGWVPTFNATYQYSNALKGGFMNFDHVGVLTLSVPIYDGGSKNSKIRQAKQDIVKTQTNMELLQESLAQNDEQYRYELKSALEAYELQKTNLEVATEVLKQYQIKYEHGSLSSLQLTQANTNYLSAETSYAEACLNVVMAQTKLQKLYNNL